MAKLFPVFKRCFIGLVVVSMIGIAGCAQIRVNQADIRKDPRPDNMKPRLLILTDIGGDPDDQQSLIRLALYFNEFEMEGFIASASGTPGELDEAVTKPHLIKEIIEAYGQVLPYLRQHDPTYPDSEKLLQKVKSGNPNRGLEHIGEGHNTEGSDWIIQVVDRQDPGPVHIAIWGGQTDLFQALWKVKNNRSEQEYMEFVRRMRIYDIADQDGIFKRVLPDYPGLWYILNKAPDGADKRGAVFRGMYLGGDESLTGEDWILEHVKENHGPLGALYPMKTWTAPNPHRVMKEGDTPSWFYFLRNGLGDAEHPEWGGWGGRFLLDSSGYAFPVYRDAMDRIGEETHARATVWRWRPHFQRDFQARMDWCVMNFNDANHSPEVTVNGEQGLDVVLLPASPGQAINLSAAGTMDPDKDNLSFQWYMYPEAGSAGVVPDIRQPNEQSTEVVIPSDAAPGSTVHIVLEVMDDGEPSLTSYRRVEVRIE